MRKRIVLALLVLAPAVEQTLLPQWKETLDAFIERTSGR